MAERQKKLMLLGGLRYLLPVIEAAHRHGIHVITVDYLPGNIAHRYSDEYHNVSIIDKDAVLALAQELQIDGIMSFAVDPGVVAAAYTAEKMGLPFQCSYEAACILQDKSRFRKFLADNGFNVPNATMPSRISITSTGPSSSNPLTARAAKVSLVLTTPPTSLLPSPMPLTVPSPATTSSRISWRKQVSPLILTVSQ